MSDTFYYPDPRADGGGGGTGSAGDNKGTTAPEQNLPGPAQTTLAPATTGDEIFGRKWKFMLFPPKKPEGIDLSDLHLTFSVKSQQWLTPTTLDCMIYNVAEETIKTINQFTRVILEAGYKSPESRYGKIFDGNVIYYERKRLNPTDTALRVVANSWDQIFTEAMVNTTIPEGSTQADVLKECIKSFKEFGVTPGKIADELNKEKSPRSRTITGKAVETIRDIMTTTGATCHIDEGKFNAIMKDQLMSDTAFVLNSKSGLISAAQQTLGSGISVRSLLNPQIKPMVKIQINEKSVNTLIQPTEKPVGLGATPNEQMQLTLTSRTKADGVYRSFAVVHHGDTRGQPWYSDIQTEQIDPTKMIGGIKN